MNRALLIAVALAAALFVASTTLTWLVVVFAEIIQALQALTP